MIQARVKNGQLELLSPIPEDWEGCLTQVNRVNDHEPSISELKEILADLHAMGPMEFEPGEWEEFQQEWTRTANKCGG
jgi:hypothetical protein